jgi:hypothetical protein
MRKHFKARYPAFNVSSRNGSLATDTVYSDTPAVDNGSKGAQIFIGRDSLVIDISGMKTDKELINTREDNIRIRGAMTKLISDRATAEISNKINIRSMIGKVSHITNIKTTQNDTMLQ